jgi:hypothetical protein
MFKRCPPKQPVKPVVQPLPVIAPYKQNPTGRCPAKITPKDIQNLSKAGNRGTGFPTTADCSSLMTGETDDLCYLAYEKGNDLGTDTPITQETVDNPRTQADDGILLVNCIGRTVTSQHFLCLEEDESIFLEKEQTTETFITQSV